MGSADQRQGTPVKRRRRRHVSSTPRPLLWLVVIVAIAIAAPTGIFFYRVSQRSLANRRAEQPDPAISPERRALVDAVNKMIAGTGKDVPASDLVVGTTTVHKRDGVLYLAGTVQNRGSRAYARVHVIFDTTDRYHNPAGVLEADVTDVQPQKDAAFDIGPMNPHVFTIAVRSIRPVE